MINLLMEAYFTLLLLEYVRNESTAVTVKAQTTSSRSSFN
jgi:hypothetical protein